MKKLLSIVLGAVLVPVVAFSGVGATTAVGQIEGGNIYKAKNVTKGGVFEDPTNATCNDLVKLRVEIHNPGPVALQNVKVAATVPTGTATTHSSQVTVSASNANPASTSDTAGIKLDKAGKLSYVAGSAEYFDPTGSRLGSISDSIVAGGATVPNGVGVSFDQRRYVQFQVKVECEAPEVKNIKVCELATKNIVTIREDQFDASKHSRNLNDCKEVPVPGKIQVCELATKKVITINENDFDSTKHSKNLNDCAEVLGAVTPTPTVIASTGPASAIATMFGLSALAAGIGYAVQRRRNILG